MCSIFVAINIALLFWSYSLPAMLIFDLLELIQIMIPLVQQKLKLYRRYIYED